MNGRVVCFLRPDAHKALAKVEELLQALPELNFTCVALAPSAAMTSLLARMSAQHSNLTVRAIENFGTGAAYRAGSLVGSESIIGFLNLDGVIAPTDITHAFARLLASGADVWIGDRWSSPRTSASWTRRTISHAFNAFTGALFGLPWHDIQSPLKLMKRTVIDTIFADLRLANVGFDAELLSAIERGHFRVVEEPLRWTAVGYEFAVVPTAASVLFSLLFLRIMRSPLRRIPFIDTVGRGYALPVKRAYDILIFCWRDPQNPLAGGGEVYLHEQAKVWVRKGHRVTWFTQRFRGSLARENVDGVDVVRSGGVPSVFLAGAWWYATRSTRSYDFILDCMNGVPFFTPLFSTKPKVCLVYHLHSGHFREELGWPLAPLAVWVETKLVPLIYRRTPFMTISPSTQHEMIRMHISARPIDVVESGVPSELIPGAKAQRPTILYLGRLKAYKRVRDLIDAFVAIRDEVVGAQLIIAGDGDDRDSLQTYARARGANGIIFTGKVDAATKLRLLQEAWVFGMPSSIEGWGIVVIEANACGTPAVAYDVPGLRDSISDGSTGFLAADPATFETLLRTVLTDAEVRNRLSTNARAWAAKYSWDRTAQNTLEQIRRAQPWRAVFEPDAEASWRLQITSLGEQH